MTTNEPIIWRNGSPVFSLSLASSNIRLRGLECSLVLLTSPKKFDLENLPKVGQMKVIPIPRKNISKITCGLFKVKNYPYLVVIIATNVFSQDVVIMLKGY